MCDLEVGRTVLVGPLAEVQAVLEKWEAYYDAWGQADVSPPRLQSLEGLERALPETRRAPRSFSDPLYPAVAVVHHDPRLGHGLAHRLQAEFATDPELRLHGGGGVMAEPLFTLELASATPSASNPMPTFDPARIQQAAAATQPGPGTTAAIIDSGDAAGGNQMMDFVQGAARPIAPADPVGHGTAVAGLVRSLRPRATLRRFGSSMRTSGATRATCCSRLSTPCGPASSTS